MASHSTPRMVTVFADAAITRGMAVKHGTDFKHCAKSAATTDKHFGIAMSSPAAAEDLCEVALPGGGAKGLLQATVTTGQLLTSHTDGKLKPVATASDRVIAMAMQPGVAGDLIDVEVVIAQGTATEA